MNARDRLYLIACQDMPVTSDEVEEAINDFAHELAEQIRQNYGKPRIDGDCPGTHHSGYNAGTHNAADLIDPKVQHATTSEETTR